jgi:UDP-N-acetylmuramate dehydrogenase
MTMRDSRLRENASLARLTYWRAGGTAERLFEPADVEAVAAYLAELPADEPVTWLGLGSNVLIRDGGIRGSVIRTPPGLTGIKRVGDDEVDVGAGLACAKLARFCSREGLRDAAFFAGIPGTVGGALAMNAGAWGGETWPHVVSVTTLDRSGVRQERAPTDYRIGYREVVAPAEEWFLSARLRFRPGGDPAELNERIRELLNQRAESQPTGVASCGSVFRNPRGDHAARLIEAAGLKGFRIGGAHVSEKHANFIINDNGASAADIEALIAAVRERVASASGTWLEPEVRIIGEEATAT